MVAIAPIFPIIALLSGGALVIQFIHSFDSKPIAPIQCFIEVCMFLLGIYGFDLSTSLRTKNPVPIHWNNTELLDPKRVAIYSLLSIIPIYLLVGSVKSGLFQHRYQSIPTIYRTDIDSAYQAIHFDQIDLDNSIPESITPPVLVLSKKSERQAGWNFDEPLNDVQLLPYDYEHGDLNTIVFVFYSKTDYGDGAFEGDSSSAILTSIIVSRTGKADSQWTTRGVLNLIDTKKVESDLQAPLYPQFRTSELKAELLKMATRDK